MARSGLTLLATLDATLFIGSVTVATAFASPLLGALTKFLNTPLRALVTLGTLLACDSGAPHSPVVYRKSLSALSPLGVTRSVIPE